MLVRWFNMTKNMIKEVALKLFANKGYEQTSLSMIAKEVGIKTPSFYAFYKSKEDLFLTIVYEAFTHHCDYIKQVSRSFSNETTEKKLFKILREMYSYHLREEDKTNFCRRFLMFAPEGLEGRIHEEFQKSDVILSKAIEEIFTTAILSGEVRNIPLNDLVSSFLCLMDGLFAQLFYYDRVPEILDHRLTLNWNNYWSGIQYQSSNTKIEDTILIKGDKR
jgi:AcrR family transcriptional regulator